MVALLDQHDPSAELKAKWQQFARRMYADRDQGRFSDLSASLRVVRAEFATQQRRRSVLRCVWCGVFRMQCWFG